MENNLYVIVRNDLSRSQKAVQGIHASAELLLNHESLYWDNGTVVFLRVRDEDELLKLENKLKEDSVTYSFFREPDIGNQMTAIALFGEKNMFTDLTLG